MRSIEDAGRLGPYIYTEAGPFNYFTTDTEGIDLHMISRSLSRTVRYRGMTPVSYSVALHSYIGARLFQRCSLETLQGLTGIEEWSPALRDRMALLFLLHDAPEAYIGDIPTPIKNYLGVLSHPLWDCPEDDDQEGFLESVQSLENDINRRIHAALDIPAANKAQRMLLKLMDQRMFQWEFEWMYGADTLAEVMGSGFGVGPERCHTSVTSGVTRVADLIMENLYSSGEPCTDDVAALWYALCDTLMGGSDTLVTADVTAESQ